MGLESVNPLHSSLLLPFFIDRASLYRLFIPFSFALFSIFLLLPDLFTLGRHCDSCILEESSGRGVVPHLADGERHQAAVPLQAELQHDPEPHPSQRPHGGGHDEEVTKNIIRFGGWAWLCVLAEGSRHHRRARGILQSPCSSLPPLLLPSKQVFLRVPHPEVPIRQRNLRQVEAKGGPTAGARGNQVRIARLEGFLRYEVSVG